ncbi:unnamed protein product [Mytilus edulis]|uniref:Uncharacterized protein n=1 Tax=Mytilus edulis TaxID=6550 RepID=A0A8S3PSS0_MYTED|nr:unnamed protein product [Mytilus edulis]
MNYTEDKELSRDFYHYLCNIIGSEDVVKTRRNIFTVMDFIINTDKHFTFISSGSRAEGIDLKGSDYDQMQVREGFRVYESIMDEYEGVLDEIYTSNKLPLLMDTLDTKPGFTKLKLYNKVRIHTNTMQLTEKWSYTFGNDTFLSSKIIRESELYPGTVIHGPCKSTTTCLKERFTDEQQAELLYTLRLMYTSPWVSIFATSTFQKYITDSGNSPILNLTSSSLSCLFYPHLLMQNRMLKLDHTTIKRSLMAFIYFPHDEFCKYMMSVGLNKCTQRFNVLIFNRSNKSFYKDYNKTLGGSMLGLFSDALTSWLQLASFFYKCKRFELCIDIITYCLSKCTTDNIIVRVSNSLKEQTVFQKIKQAVGLCLTCKHFILQDVRFINPFQLLPIELITLTTIYKNVKIPPVVYCNMLLFLCFHHLHDASGKRNAVRDLELTIRAMCFIDEDNFGTVDRCLEIINEMI